MGHPPFSAEDPDEAVEAILFSGVDRLAMMCPVAVGI